MNGLGSHFCQRGVSALCDRQLCIADNKYRQPSDVFSHLLVYEMGIRGECTIAYRKYGFSDILVMDVERFKEHVHQGSLEEDLDTLGFAVVDGAFGDEFCRTVREEIDLLEQQSLLNSGKNMLTNAQGHGVVMIRPNIFERDLVLEGQVVDDAVLELLPCLSRLYWEQGGELTMTISRGYSRLQLKHIDTIKVQKNTGSGGCFPMHFDTSTATSKRDLTAVLYLNEGWTEEHGGQLRVYPFPYEPKDIPPLNDRVVFFSSHQMVHRVLPAARTRYVLSIWFAREGEPVSFPRMPLPATKLPFEDQQILAFLYRPTNRRVLAKLLYAAEWADSVRESFGEDLAVDQALEVHWIEVNKLERSINPNLWALLQQCLPLPLPQ